jgi:hypothetical protein
MSGPAAAQWYPAPGGGAINDPGWAGQMWSVERQTEEMDARRYDRRQEERLRQLENRERQREFIEGNSWWVGTVRGSH